MEANECNGFDTLFEKSVPHILERIFFYLDYESFKTCGDVCKVWKDLLTSQTFRRKAKTMFSGEILKAELCEITFLDFAEIKIISCILIVIKIRDS